MEILSERSCIIFERIVVKLAKYEIFKKNVTFQNGMGVLATLRHHKDFADALKDEPFVGELKKSLEARTRS